MSLMEDNQDPSGPSDGGLVSLDYIEDKVQEAEALREEMAFLKEKKNARMRKIGIMVGLGSLVLLVVIVIVAMSGRPDTGSSSKGKSGALDENDKATSGENSKVNAEEDVCQELLHHVESQWVSCGGEEGAEMNQDCLCSARFGLMLVKLEETCDTHNELGDLALDLIGRRTHSCHSCPELLSKGETTCEDLCAIECKRMAPGISKKCAKTSLHPAADSLALQVKNAKCDTTPTPAGDPKNNTQENPQTEAPKAVPQSPPDYCTSWFDGCNVCMVEDGIVNGCTKMSCEKQEEPECREFGPPTGCSAWFDGCNNCAVENGTVTSCTEMACAQNKAPACTKFSSPSKDCEIWFDGCNDCTIGDFNDDSSWACTEKFCAVQEEPTCVKMRDVPTPITGSTEFYFGNGCFWERQYAYANIELQKELRPCTEGTGSAACPTEATLDRTFYTVTAQCGYAGGTKKSSNGLVCYHHSGSRDDFYGRLGHAEVVAVTLDNAKLEEQYKIMIKDYFESFHDVGGKRVRPDPGDRGSDYRNLLGLPGGINSPLMKHVREANTKYKMMLVEGKGDENDVLNTVHIMDSNDFPFYRAEQYHQFHSNFFGEAYPLSYIQKLYNAQLTHQLIKPTGCPKGRHWRLI